MGATWRDLSCIGDSLHTGGWFGRCPLSARDRYEAAMRIHGSYSGDDLSVRGGVVYAALLRFKIAGRVIVGQGLSVRRA